MLKSGTCVASVWLSFEFTYLSNSDARTESATAVWLSFEFTYLSNGRAKPWMTPTFDYPLNLHISQTIQQQHPEYDSLIILWIYISLKRQKLHRRLLSVWLSFEFTYLSNEHYQNLHSRKFDYPLNLHISQTPSAACSWPDWFDYPLNLHISQTPPKGHFCG